VKVFDALIANSNSDSVPPLPFLKVKVVYSQYSIYLPRRDGRLSWPGWLVTYTEMVYPPTDVPIQVLTGDRTQCRLTTLIKANALTTTLRRHP